MQGCRAKSSSEGPGFRYGRVTGHKGGLLPLSLFQKRGTTPAPVTAGGEDTEVLKRVMG
jgi:hypothetical protein